MGLGSPQASRTPPRHDGAQVSPHRAHLAVPGQGAPIVAVRRFRLHNHKFRRMLRIAVDKIPGHGPRHTPHARLEEHVGGPLLHLLRRLVGHGGVALHNPGGYLLIPLPGGVLNHHAVGRPGGLSGGHADAVVVVDLLDGHLSALPGDVVKAALGAALGHMDHRLLPQPAGRPGHSPAVVAVGGGKEGGLPEFLPEPGAGEVLIGQLRHIPSQLLGDIPGNGKGAPQHLKGVETEAEGLVLDPQAAQAQPPGHAVQPGQRGGGVLGEGAVKGPGLGRVLQGHNPQAAVLTGGQVVQGPFYVVSHPVFLHIKTIDFRIRKRRRGACPPRRFLLTGPPRPRFQTGHPWAGPPPGHRSAPEPRRGSIWHRWR